jgi:hypothetical protein
VRSILRRPNPLTRIASQFDLSPLGRGERLVLPLPLRGIG